jgi:hypothetical protein
VKVNHDEMTHTDRAIGSIPRLRVPMRFLFLLICVYVVAVGCLGGGEGTDALRRIERVK